MKKSVILNISGRVQGVGYRYSCKRKADELQAFGFVKNLLNGDVYAEVEAEEIVLDEFLVCCKTGPPRAIVFDIKIQNQPLQNFKFFLIK